MALVYPDLGKAVTEAWNEIIKEVPASFFREQIKNAMWLANSSIEAHISYYLKGMYYGTGSGNPQDPNGMLERLSVFLFALGFPGKDGKYQGVLDGLESMAKIRGHTFTFPPLEDKRISHEGIKAKYEKQKGSAPNNNEEKAEKNKKASAHDNITRMLAVPNGNNPTIGHTIGHHYGLQTDEGYIRNVLNTSRYPVSSLTLGISDPDGKNCREYTISYSTFGVATGMKRNILFKALQQFLEETRGKKVRIAHHHKIVGLPIVKMIAVDGSDTVYYRDGKAGGVLGPYALKAGRYVGV